MDDACGPESLQYALRRDGRGASLAALAKLCKVRQDNGTYTSSLVAALAARGYKPWTSCKRIMRTALEAWSGRRYRMLLYRQALHNFFGSS